jgi:1-acyl-sn-glycerol-3-phosphate acyltransferase
MVRALAIELQPQRARTLEVKLSSKLDRDLGIDSLARAELALRFERSFGVSLPESDIAEAETPGDYVTALVKSGARVATGQGARIETQSLPAVDAFPSEATTLVEALEWHVAAHPDRLHLALSDGNAVEHTFTYRQLSESARAVAGGLQARGLAKGDRAALMLPTSPDFFEAFFGILYAGGVPVPIYPPARMSQLEDHLRRQSGILENSQAKILITVTQARSVAALMTASVEESRASVVTVEELKALNAKLSPQTLSREDLALIQYTSGSTGQPKGVMLTHGNLLANVRAMIGGLQATSRDVLISWLPLYHDMGLIGAWLATMYASVPVVIMSPLAFLSNPSRWLKAISVHRGTISVVPNFAYELCVRRIVDSDLEGVDLSSLRFLGNGAEPVRANSLRAFAERFAKFGLNAGAIAPVYGLAECSVGLAFSPPGRGLLTQRIDRDALRRAREVAPADPDDDTALEIVACGRPLPNHEARIVDETGREVGEDHEGLLQFRGPSTTQGYFRNKAATDLLFAGDWLQSGDYAYISGGDIYITGRRKDLIIRAGRNIHPADIEESVQDVPGVRRGCVAAFGAPDADTGTDKVVIVAETRERDDGRRQIMRDQIAEAASKVLDGAPDEVVLVGPNRVAKTSSGKIRRADTKNLYLAGTLDAAPLALWRQLLRLGIGAATVEARRYWRVGATLAFAGYWWTAMGVAIVVGCGSIALAPSVASRWRGIGMAARLGLRLTGAMPTVDGLQHVPAQGGVIVANHASYLDAMALIAAIPGEYVFVAKGELAARFPAGWLLRRLGTLFVDRADRDSGPKGTAVAIQAAQLGARMVFFPEGTLMRQPGLLAFKLGAFAVAVGASQPIVPVALTGTRTILRGGQWFPRSGKLYVHIGPPIKPEGEGMAAAIALRDRARGFILAHCGEPDRTADRLVFTAEGVERAE